MKRLKSYSLLISIFLSTATSALALPLTHLEMIRENHVLRVCTTGDYPPFTLQKNGRFLGSDINMAKTLAKHLGVNVLFVKTTWTTMSNDLMSNKCDIAMGGISATPKRHQDFLLTHPTMKFGKVPLVRCSDIGKYLTLTDIDKPNVRIVENKGGTNEHFAKTYIKHAKLIIVDKNNKTFLYLLNSKADVMFTDNIEAVYRHKIMPELCAVRPDHPFSTSYKVYMLPRTSTDLLGIVNKWIQTISRNNRGYHS